jgi:pimeloyl-ACP methyl ester carboxylesterase
MNILGNAMKPDGSNLDRKFAEGIGYLRRPGRPATAPLVLLHGVGSNGGSFAALMQALPNGIDAIAWDAPGYGQSAPLEIEAPSPRHYADALAKFLDALKLPTVALAGHSLGCLFAGSFARHYPERVSALALFSPALGYGIAPGAQLPPGVQSRIDEIVELGPKAFAKKRAPRLVGDPQARPDIVAAVEQAMGSVNPPGYIQAVRALGAGQLLTDAASIRTPAIVAVGTRDLITPPANAHSLYAALANPAGIHEVPGAGHAMPQEEPVIAAQLLAQMITSPAHV